jgi:hypothetical protein
VEVSGQLHGPAALPLAKELPVPLKRRVGGSQMATVMKMSQGTNTYIYLKFVFLSLAS